jgi:hypothetical protein
MEYAHKFDSEGKHLQEFQKDGHINAGYMQAGGVGHTTQYRNTKQIQGGKSSQPR